MSPAPVEQGQRGVGDRGPGLLEHAHRRIDRIGNLGGRHAVVDTLADDAHADAAQVGERLERRYGAAGRVRIARVVPGDGLIEHRRIGNRLGHGAYRVHEPRHGEGPVTAHRSPRRTQPHDAAPARRAAYGACGIAAERCRAERRRDGHAGAAAGLTGLACFVPRVAGNAERVLHVAAERVFAEVQLAEEHRARLAEPPDSRGVLLRDVVDDVAADRRAQSLGVELILHRDGQAVERAASCAASKLGLGVPRGAERPLLVERDVGVEPRESLSPGDERLGQLHRRQLTASDQRGELRSGPQRQVLRSLLP